MRNRIVVLLSFLLILALAASAWAQTSTSAPPPPPPEKKKAKRVWTNDDLDQLSRAPFGLTTTVKGEEKKEEPASAAPASETAGAPSELETKLASLKRTRDNEVKGLEAYRRKLAEFRTKLSEASSVGDAASVEQYSLSITDLESTLIPNTEKTIQQMDAEIAALEKQIAAGQKKASKKKKAAAAAAETPPAPK